MILITIIILITIGGEVFVTHVLSLILCCAFVLIRFSFNIYSDWILLYFFLQGIIFWINQTQTWYVLCWSLNKGFLLLFGILLWLDAEVYFLFSFCLYVATAFAAQDCTRASHGNSYSSLYPFSFFPSCSYLFGWWNRMWSRKTLPLGSFLLSKVIMLVRICKAIIRML